LETQPTSGTVGAGVKILGTNLTGATSVTFNGTAATFNVKSKSLITTTVPTGATTGTVQVITHGGTHSSNVLFRVGESIPRAKQEPVFSQSQPKPRGRRGDNMSKLNCGNWMIKACVVLLLSATTASALPAQTPAAPTPTPIFTTLHSFDDVLDGANPYAGLVQGANGKFYGTTGYGGANAYYGTVFNITPRGVLTTLHTFDSTDGANSNAGLVQGADGKFYGTASSGGTNNTCVGGCGTIFTITPGGTLATLYNFCSQSNCTDGSAPEAGLVQGSDGNFYGTTAFGGASGACTHGCGTVFKITPSGMLTTLHSFNLTDGRAPLAGLVQGANGNFYGTTSNGGANGDGTVFKITSSGTFTTLHTFDFTDGAELDGALVQANDGNFYGTTFLGGANDFCGTDNHQSCGTVFKMTPGGNVTTLYSFCSQGGTNCTDGEYPYAGLIQGTDGNFYGTTSAGGSEFRNCGGGGCGTVFSITSGGALTTLYNFCSQINCTDGAEPEADIVQGTDGTLYGTTASGGTYSNNCNSAGCGTVFSLSAGLGPFVETQPTSGKVGKAVKILGTNLTGATSVTFNGTAATFTVKSKSEISTTVPVGATTGTVQVVTPRRTLSSNVPFRVAP
jgi:uncharacterized repeat protein (TIGR03803 family)